MEYMRYLTKDIQHGKNQHKLNNVYDDPSSALFEYLQ